MHIIYDIKNKIASELAGFGFWQLNLSTAQNDFSNFRPGWRQFCWITCVNFNSIQSIIVWSLHITQFTVCAAKNLTVFVADSPRCLKWSSMAVVTIIATLGVLWASRRVASPSIEIPIHFLKKKFPDKLHKSYKKHPWQTSPTFSGHFTLQAEPKINWNNYISMVLWACFSNKICIYQKTNNQNGGCYDHMTHEISLAGSHSLHWGRVQWKIPCLRAKRFS